MAYTSPRMPTNSQEAAGIEAILKLQQDVRVIVVAGMYRSGSTWLYNATRFLAMEAGNRVYSCWVSDFSIEQAAHAELVVVKIHDMSDALATRAWRIVTCYRDLRDVARSAIDMGTVESEEDVIPLLSDCVAQHKFWAQLAHADIRYEDIVGFAQKPLAELQTALDMPISHVACDRIAHALESLEEPNAVGSAGHDASTLMHTRHRFGGYPGRWMGALTSQTIESINTQFAEWLGRHGYTRSEETTQEFASLSRAIATVESLPEHTRVVIVTGMCGKATEWLASAAQRLLNLSGKKVRLCDPHCLSPDAVRDADFLVLKLQAPNEAIAFRAWRILTAHADLRNMTGTFAQDSADACDTRSLELLKGCVDEHAFWSARAHLDIGYEEVEEHPSTSLFRLASVVDVDLHTPAAQDIAKDLYAGGFNPEDARVRRQGGGESVPAAKVRDASVRGGNEENLRREIETRYGQWLKSYGYPIPASQVCLRDSGGSAPAIPSFRARDIGQPVRQMQGFQPRDTVVIIDVDSWADSYRVFSYASNLRRQLGSNVRCHILLLGQYKGPRLRFHNTRIDEWVPRGAIKGGGIGRMKNKARGFLGLNESKWWYSSLDNKAETVLETIITHLQARDLVVLTGDADLALFAVRAAAVLGAPGQNRVCVALARLQTACATERRQMTELGARVVFDGTDYESPTGHLMPTALVFNLDDPDETPLRPKKAPNVDWRYQLAASKMSERKPEVVLFVRPDWIRCGSATTFQTLHRHFAARRAIVVDVALQIYERDNKVLRTEKLNAVQVDLAPWFHLNLQRSRAHGRFITAAMKGIIPRTIASLLPLLYLSCHVGGKAKRWLKAIPFDYCYANHYFTLLAARDIRPNLSVLLDTHDMQSLNFVEHPYMMPLTGRKSRFSACFKDEMRIVSSADVVTMVSEEERQFMLSAAPQLRSFLYIPVPVAPPNRAFEATLNRGRQGVRLLLVASHNPANELSLRWFLESVWPLVRELGVQLDIVGSIVRAFANEDLEQVEFHGVVPDLAEYYQTADVVVLPVTNGGGIAIKTLEALQWGNAVVATSHALRGLPEDVRACLPEAPDEASFVGDLRQLIQSEERRDERRNAVDRANERLLKHDFDAVLHGYLTRMRTPLMASAKTSPTLCAEREESAFEGAGIAPESGNEPRQFFRSRHTIASVETGTASNVSPKTEVANVDRKGTSIREIETALRRYYEEDYRGNDLLIKSMEDVHLDGEVRLIHDMLQRAKLHDQDFRIFWAFTDPTETIIDAGANYGYSAASIWSAGATASILAFDPIIPYQQCLEAIAQAASGKYDYRMVALGEREEELTFVMPVANGNGISALTSADRNPHIDSLAEAIQVHIERHLSLDAPVRLRLLEFKTTATTVDTILSGGNFQVSTARIAAIKIDTEGFEPYVVRGARETLIRHKPLVMVEKGKGIPKVSQYLEAIGYLYAERKADYLVRDEVQAPTGNSFYIHKDRLAEYRRSGLLKVP